MPGASNLEDKKKVLHDEEFEELWNAIIDTKVRKKATVKLQMKQPYYIWKKIQCGIKTKVLLYAFPPGTMTQTWAT